MSRIFEKYIWDPYGGPGGQPRAPSTGYAVYLFHLLARSTVRSLLLQPIILTSIKVD
jgi:hypothetical protein